MKKAYYLATCDTCTRIFKELGSLLDDFEKQEIKSQGISLEQVDEMKERSGSYESLFSRRAMKFRSMGLGDKNLGEQDYRKLISEEYTFLKRPVFIVDDQIFVGNSRKVIEALRDSLEK